VWYHYPEHRFGQMVVHALMRSLGVSAHVNIRAITDDELQTALSERWAEYSQRERFIARGPYWDTETQDGRRFTNGLPRDPARIAPFLKTLTEAWEKHPDAPLGALLAAAAGSWRLVGIEDGQLRRQLEDLGAQLW
jgi:hypothetical protein